MVTRSRLPLMPPFAGLALGLLSLAGVLLPVQGLAQAPVANVPLSALQFNGQRAQAVEAPETSPSVFNVEQSLTIEAWVKVSAWSKRYQAIVTKGDGWGLVRADNSAKIAFRTAIPGQVNGYHDLVSTVNFPVGEWTHVAAVWTGSRKLLYTNGQLVADEVYSSGVISSSHPLMIGANAQNVDRTFQGMIDSVRVWSVARAAEQLEKYRLENLRGSEVGLLADWRFNDASGTLAADSSAGGRHATLRVSKPTSGAGVLPIRVNGLAFTDAGDGALAMFFNNRTSQYPASLGGSPVTLLQHVDLPAPAGAFDFANGLTAELWIRPQALPSDGTGYVSVVSKGLGAWEIRYRDTGKISFFTKNVQSNVPAGDVEELISQTRVEPRQWTHVAVVWDPVAKEKRLYINGVLDATTPVNGSLGLTALPVTVALQPGSATPSKAYFGATDELRLWGIVRTAQELFDNYHSGMNGTEPGLRGVWSFDKADGPTTPEGSGRALAGQLSMDMSALNRVDGVAINAPRLGSYTLDLDGQSQYVTIADDPSLNGFTSLTLEAWIKPKTPKAPGFMMIISKGEAGYGLALDAEMHVRYMVNSSPLNALKSTAKVPLDTWSHVAVVVDGVAKKTTFYINGKASGSFDSSVIPNSAGALCIGKAGGPTLANFFHGSLDEVRIWNLARTPTEILLLAFNELGGPTAGLAGHWSFTEGSGSTVADNTGSKKGTLNGTTDSSWKAGPLFPQVPTLPLGLNLVQNPRSAGLWVGEVVLTKVNEVQKAVNGAAEEVSPTQKEATLRIILHVDAQGQVRLLKDLIVMQTQAPGVPLPPAKTVLVTDPSQIHKYEGVVRRNGKLVGLRYSTVAYDFPGYDITMIGGIGPGMACGGRIDIDKSAPTNPYRHKFHPAHEEGFDIVRVFSLEFEGLPGDPLKVAPGYGVDRIVGTYRESIAGLHKITLKTAGTVTLNRISTVSTLNVP
jgi:hypothetical protein